MKFNKLFSVLALFVALTMCFSCFGFLTAFADETEQVNKWDLLEAAYMTKPFSSIVDRIYSEGPKADELTGNIPSMKQVVLFEGKEAGYVQYSDASSGEIVVLKLVDRDGDGEYDKHPDYLDKPIYDIDGNEAYIMDYCGYWSTNPYSIGNSSAATSVKAQLYSQLIIEYSDNGVVDKYYSFEESALLDQIKVSGIKNGTRVEYTVGQQAVKYLVPYFITEAKYLALMETVKAGLRQTYIDNDRDYIFYSERLESKYKRYDETNSTGQAEFVIKAVENLGTACYLFDYRTAGKNLIEDIEEFIKTYSDYSYEQLDEDHAETGYTVATEDPASFKLAIEYTVDDIGLSVRCSAGNLRFDASSFQLTDVHLLPYAGAGNTANDGFAFYPDGSGAIIDFDDAQKTFTLVTTAYGQDYSFSTIAGANNEVARLPVYGISETATDADGNKRSSGYFAYVEEGESLADITVNAASSSHPYLQAYTKFNPRPSDQYSLSGGISSGSTMWTVEAKRKYTRNYKLRIFILDETDTSYSAMANNLRSYLLNNGTITLMDTEGEGKDIPLVIETLGALEITDRFLGVPYNTMQALTSFDNIKESIIDNFKGDHFPEAVNNIVIKLNGWLDGGLDSAVPSGVEVEDVIGGKEGFESLIEYCKANGVTLYPDFEFGYSKVDKMFDGFDADDDLARTIDDRKAYKKVYNPVYQTYDRSNLGVISANRMMHFYDETYAEYKEYGVGAIGVSSLGEVLNSDFNEDDPLNREDAKVLLDRLLNKISSENDKVLLSGGNIYTAKYADLILDAPLEDSMLRYTSAAVPFYSMVLHGCVEYAGTALNLAGDMENAILKTIESGAVPYFIVAVQNSSDLKNDESYSKYYSVRYSIWMNDIYETYVKVNNALGDVRFNQIVKHEFIDNYYQVARVTYDNGVSIVINYGTSDYTFYDNGLYTIGASDFVKFVNGAPVVE